MVGQMMINTLVVSADTTFLLTNKKNPNEIQLFALDYDGNNSNNNSNNNNKH
jgi:hypothetical protein